MVYEDDGGYHAHIIPIDDLREHELHADCWCNPDEDDDEYGIWVHRALDRREEYETDGMKH